MRHLNAAILAALNRTAPAAAAPVPFGFLRADAPLGLIVLGFAMVFALLAVAPAAALHAAMLVEARRQTHEVKNPLAAHLGELDDKLDRLAGGRILEPPP